MEELIPLNRPQLSSIILSPKNRVDIWGRGTGKSFGVGWDINQLCRRMPRSISSVTGRTYTQILTRTLPSTFKFLESLGYVKDKNYVIGRRPPKFFNDPFEKVMRYDNFISFSNGTGLLLLSQDRAGSSRGPNVDFEIVDEALTLNKEQYDQEVSPTNRGNDEHFEKIPFHHGFHYTSSMPYTYDQKWLLSFGDYYEKESGVRIYEVWNRIVKLQLKVLDAAREKNTKEFRDIWNETIRLKKQISPFVSKEGTLFTLANAFDNLDNVGLSYLLREYEKQALLIFLVELMNYIVDKVENCYYRLDDSKHIYYNAENDDYVRGVAENTSWDFNEMSVPTCMMDLDWSPNDPIEIVFDWGSKISLMSVAQEKDFDFVTGEKVRCDNTINEFFVKPDETPTVMINDLIDKFCAYYNPHVYKTLKFYRDRYGDNKQANSSKSYNEQAIDRLEKNGWFIEPYVHKGKEPPQHDKYLMFANILQSDDPKYPRFRINGQKCKYTVISMNNTRVIEKDGKFWKDKTSERRESVLPEEATHFGDAVDKRIYTKYNELLTDRGTFIPFRTSNH